MVDVDALVALGFFRLVEPDSLDDVVERSREWPFVDDVQRLFQADAEDLAEHGIRELLVSIVPFLQSEGVAAEVTHAGARVETLALSLKRGAPPVEITEDDLEESETYLLYLGDREFPVYREGDDDDSSWELATKATLALLNEILAGHGSHERAYAYSGGNDLHIAFVTPEMRDVINAGVGPSDRLTSM